MKKVTFYYVRHGQTEYNVKSLMQGWCDSPLTEKGREDAVKAREMLANIKLDKAFCSVSQRCKDTCAIILKDRDIPVVYDEGLRETHFGSFEGVYLYDHLEEINHRRLVTLDWSDVGGENAEMTAKRIMETYQRIFDQCEDGDNVLIVSHGSIFLRIMTVLLKVDKDLYYQLVKNNNLGAVIPNGLLAVFTRTDDEYELKELIGKDPKIVKTLNENKIA